jgi:hypothetical protein
MSYYRKRDRGFYGEIGHWVYNLIFIALLYTFIKIYGIGSVNEVYMFIFFVISFKLTGWFLRFIGVWQY